MSKVHWKRGYVMELNAVADNTIKLPLGPSDLPPRHREAAERLGDSWGEVQETMPGPRGHGRLRIMDSFDSKRHLFTVGEMGMLFTGRRGEPAFIWIACYLPNALKLGPEYNTLDLSPPQVLHISEFKEMGCV